MTATPTLADFEATLRRHDSATLALEEWCTIRGLAYPARVTAQTLAQTNAALPANLHEALGIASDEAFALRNVRLSCGGAVLSVAWNWYVPSRLTAPMNEALARSDAPFGKVVAPLGFRRKSLSMVAGPAENCPADTISTHQAMLVLPDGRPLAYLVECYTAANLAPLR
ncbi:MULTISPECIES: hypothetical protein [unclassified Novosphingobium]|uniref:hypothetical protein n=1 Tax=unclassified Novosphingobium TaxID=2644732 RepID=UPI001F383F12|nr:MULTISPECIES: hypothetical protein [unclassified Novosphingobium]